MSDNIRCDVINSYLLTWRIWRITKWSYILLLSPDGNTRNQIDYIAIDKRWFSSMLDAKSYPGADGDSDHNLVIAKMRMKALKIRKKEEIPLRFDLNRLAEHDVKTSFAVETENRFEALLEHWDESSTPNENWGNMEDIWIQSATDIIGKAKKQKTKPWISDQVIDMAVKKREAKKKGDHIEYNWLKREIQRMIRRDKNAWLEKECAQIDEYDRFGKARAMYNKVKSVKKRPFQANQACINDKNSITLTAPEEVLNRWHEYGANLFEKPVNERPLSTHSPEDQEPLPLLAEVEQAVGMLKCGKAPGLDGVPTELIQHSGPASMQVLLKLCIQIWCSCSWPDAWKRQEIVMIHKSGNTKECTNYRTIALLSHASKVLLIILLKRMREKIEYELPDEQAGFRRGRSTADMLVALQVLIEKTIEMDGQAFVVFINYSKAFDSISQVQMFEILTEMGFPKHLVALLEALYNDQSAVIRWNGRHSSAFKIERGVRQRCILSPHLFNLYTESVIREAGIEEIGIKIGGKLVSNLRYSDDTALCANSQEEAERLIGKVNIIGKSRLLKLNVKKTKLLKIGKMQCDAGVSVDDEEIEVVEHFKYLGSLKAADGNCSKDTRSRIGMAKKRMLDLVPIWKDRGITTDLKMKLVRSLVWTVLTYGAEGWTLTKADEKRIQSAELWIYRRMLRVSWTEHRTDDSILTELGTTRQLLGFVVRRKLSFFGHTIRDGGCELVKCMIQGKVSGKRRRGRPKTSYSSNITKWTSVGTERRIPLITKAQVRSCPIGPTHLNGFKQLSEFAKCAPPSVFNTVLEQTKTSMHRRASSSWHYCSRMAEKVPKVRA